MPTMYSFELVHIHIEEVDIERETFDEIKKVLDELLEFKKKYGQGVK